MLTTEINSKIFKISFTKNKFDNKPTPSSWKWEGLKELFSEPILRAVKDGKGFCPTQFKNGNRKNEEVEELSLLVIEYDHDESIQNIVINEKKWMNWIHLLYSTHSHCQKTKSNPHLEDRFRLVFPLKNPIPANLYPLLYEWAIKFSEEKIDQECNKLSLPFYLPAVKSIDAPFFYKAYEFGDLLDWESLNLKPKPKKTRAKTATKSAMAPSSMAPYVWKAINEEVGKLRNTQSGLRNGQLYKSAAALGEFIPNGYLNEATIYSELHLACIENNSIEDDGERQFKNTTQQGIKKGIKNPRVIEDPKNLLPEAANETSKSPIPPKKPTSKNATDKKSLDNRVGRIQKLIQKLGYKFRLNEVNEKIEFLINETPWKDFKKRDFSTLFINIKACRGNSKLPESEVNHLIHSEFCSTTFHPFREYLDSLTWDGEDHLKDLFESIFFMDEERREFNQQLIKYWLIATAAAWYVPHLVNDAVLLLKGAQYIGKSTWLNNLIKQTPLSKYLIVEKTLKSDQKDSMIALSERALINLDDLGALSKVEANEIKQIISKPEVALRRAYGRNAENLERNASFSGSTNNNSFLTDLTGNRRWWVLQIKGIDFEKCINYNQIWAQVFHLFREGKPFKLTKEEVESLNIYNERFLISSLEEDLVQKYCQKTALEAENNYYTSTELANKLVSLEHLSFAPGGSFLWKLGNALSKHGFKKYPKTKKRIQKWHLNLKELI